jgi:ribonuclease PH
LKLAINSLLEKGVLKTDPITDHVAAVSCGIYAGQPVLDLDYQEDSDAGTDANFVLTGAGNLIEVQASAEGATFSRFELDALITLAEGGVSSLVSSQKSAVKTND